jgi:hypothetical protein
MHEAEPIAPRLMPLQLASSKSTLPYAFLVVVIGPAVFWAAIAFLVCTLTGLGSPAEVSMTMFTIVTGMLTLVAGVFHLRL